MRSSSSYPILLITPIFIALTTSSNTLTPDDIYPPPSAQDQNPSLSVIGGAGTYSAIGARLLSPPPTSSSVGWIIDAGTDFPPTLGSTIDSWSTSALFRPRDARTTRGWNGYGENEHRAFKYLTEKKRLTADDLTAALLASRSFHLICSPTRCIDLVRRILGRRTSELNLDPVKDRPWMIWEPAPDLCTPEELRNTYTALQYVDIISPNHDELAALFASTPYATPPPKSSDFNRAAVEMQTSQFLARGLGPTTSGAVVVRAGKEGCFVASLDKRKWLPAYHQSGEKVIDPTGGGNGFLGGFAVGLVRTKGEVVEAARWGSVAASLCIEQVGMPELTTQSKDKTGEGERWNGCSVKERLEEFRKRTG